MSLGQGTLQLRSVYQLFDWLNCRSDEKACACGVQHCARGRQEKQITLLGASWSRAVWQKLQQVLQLRLVLHLQVLICRCYPNTDSLPHRYCMPVLFGLCHDPHSLGLDASCAAGHLPLQYDCLPVWKRLYPVWVLHQICAIAQPGYQLTDFPFQDHRLCSVRFNLGPNRRLFSEFMGMLYQKFPHSHRHSNAFHDKQTGPNPQPQHSHRKENLWPWDVKIVLHVDQRIRRLHPDPSLTVATLHAPVQQNVQLKAYPTCRSFHISHAPTPISIATSRLLLPISPAKCHLSIC